MRYTQPMAKPLASPRRPATLRDLDDLPEHVIGHIVDGELIVLPRPDMPHVLVATTLVADLFGPFSRGIGGPGGWIIMAEPKVQFGEDLFIPDKVRAEPFEAIELDLALLWKDIPADPEAAGSEEEGAGAQSP